MVSPFVFPDTGIVPHGDLVVSEFPGFRGEQVEFYEIVAKHVGIGGNPAFVSGIDVLDNPFFVRFPVVERKKGDAEESRHFPGRFEVFPGGTGSGIRQVVDHETRMDFVSCLFEKERGYGGIDASGEAYEDFHGVIRDGVLDRNRWI